MKRLILNPREERRLLRGHAWAYRNEFASIPECDDGETVDVYTADRRFVGRGFYQAAGGIAVRIMARHQADTGAVWIRERIADARAFRDRLFPDETVYRWVFGESDGLPGLVADRYGAAVAVESGCAFYARHFGAIADAFMAHEGIEGVRLAMADRTVCAGTVPDPFEVDVDGIHAPVSFESGQKTGLFLDQRTNWPLIRRFAKSARVLDGHCYRGMWSVHAALAGARETLGVDTSPPAIEAARRTAQRNGVAERCRFDIADIAEVLARNERYDVIVLDPPALAKSRGQEERALGLYQALNKAAMQSLVEDGILITSSCSHFVRPETFLDVLKRAACAARRNACLIEMRGAAPDHPVLLAMPETAYLKCAVLRIQ
mgnify:CR=1 FL=1